MALDKQTIEYVANLARIELKPEEALKLTSQLHDVLGFIDKLSQLDTQSVKPTSHILAINNVLRQDRPKKSLSQEEVLQNTAHKKGNFFVVPKVIE